MIFGLNLPNYSSLGHRDAMIAIAEHADAGTPEFHGPHIDYSDVLFSPKPSVPPPIVVGGASRAALKRAATLGDGWYGLRQSPDEVLGAVTTMDKYGRKSHFQISVRARMRIGDTAGGQEAETDGLRGDAAALTEQIKRYASAGVDQLVIEPVSTDLNDFIGQMTKFAGEVMPHSEFMLLVSD